MSEHGAVVRRKATRLLSYMRQEDDHGRGFTLDNEQEYEDVRQCLLALLAALSALDSLSLRLQTAEDAGTECETA